MKKLRVVLALVCALALLGGATATASASVVCNGPAPIRTAPNPSSPIYGYLANGQIFNVYSSAGTDWVYGHAYGLINQDGYMNRNYLC